MNNLEKQIKDRFEAIYEVSDYSTPKKKWVDFHVEMFLTLFTESVLGLESMKEEIVSTEEAIKQSKDKFNQRLGRNSLRAEIKQELLGGKA